MSEQQLVDMMEAVWHSIDSLCQGFSEEQWKTPTDCPNWSVQDQISHLVGSESRILGRPAPEHTPTETGHVRNEIGARNEEQVGWRRSRTGAQVLAEFKELTAERMIDLRAMTPEDFAAETETPIGPGTVADFLRIRIFDAWVHEQDIRRAVGQPGHMEGPVAQHSVERTALAMPFVVARRASAPDGSTAVFRVTGAAGQTVSVGVHERRGSLLEQEPSNPDVTLTMDAETFACLGCGRWDSEQTLAQGKVAIAGNQALGEAIVGGMNFMI